MFDFVLWYAFLTSVGAILILSHDADVPRDLWLLKDDPRTVGDLLPWLVVMSWPVVWGYVLWKSLSGIRLPEYR